MVSCIGLHFSLVPSKLSNKCIKLYWSSDTMRRVPKLFDRLKCESKVKIVEEQGVGARSLVHIILGVEERVGASK
jgi:hypothetical protein